MKIFKTILGCLAFLALSLQLAAQTNPPPPPSYYFVDYMKATPGHVGDYVSIEMEVWKDIHKARIKNGRITGWWFLEVQMPSGSSREYDYVTITAVSGWNAIDSIWANWDANLKGLTKTQMKRLDSTEMFRTLLRTEIYTDVDAVFKNPPGSAPPAKYWLTNYMDIHDGKWDDYMKMEKELAKPVHQEQCKNGHRDGWGVYSLVLPWGAEMKYEAVTIDFYQKWSDIVADDVGAMWKKVHPGKNMDEVGKAIESTRTLGKGELRVLLDYAQ